MNKLDFWKHLLNCHFDCSFCILNDTNEKFCKAKNEEECAITLMNFYESLN